MKGKTLDQALYALIGGLSALMAYEGPLDWRTGCAVLLAALVALKAKRSGGAEDGK